MRNRAKCKLCSSVIESLDDKPFTDKEEDWIKCKCGEIAICGGLSSYHSRVSTSYDNMLRVDDNGNEIPVQVKQTESKNAKEETFGVKPDRDQLLQMLFDQIKNSEGLPPHVRSSFVTYLDLEAALWLIYAILKAQ